MFRTNFAVGDLNPSGFRVFCLTYALVPANSYGILEGEG